MAEARGTAMGNGNGDDLSKGGSGGGDSGNGDADGGDDGRCQQRRRPQRWRTLTMEMAAMMANVDNGDGCDDGQCQ